MTFRNLVIDNQSFSFQNEQPLLLPITKPKFCYYSSCETVSGKYADIATIFVASGLLFVQTKT